MTEGEYKAKLTEVSWKLMRADPVYFGTFPVDVLVSFLEDRQSDHSVLCAYCGTSLLEDSLNSFNGSADHLLPKKKYPRLGFDAANGNSVACCSRCNSYKRDWDPNTAGDPIYDEVKDGGVISEEKRKNLIERTRLHLRKKLESRYAAWEHWSNACQQLDEARKQIVPGSRTDK
jgi:hypothetical protein